MDEEQVSLVRQAAEERRGLDHEPLEVLHEARRVLVAAAPERERVRHAAHGELERAVRPALEGRIHELVVVGGAKGAAARRERDRDFPAAREREAQLLRLVLPAVDVEEEVRAVAVAVRGVEMGGPHAQLVGVDAIGDREETGGFGFL